MKHHICHFIALLFIGAIFPVTLQSQSLSVQDVTFKQVGDDIIVRYDLSGESGKKYKVMLSVSNDYGKTYKIRPANVEGDIGKNIQSGTDKQIIWRLKRDFPGGLEGDGFVFAVDAVLQKGSKKWPYFVGAAVAGGVVYSLTAGKKEDEPTTGTISVQVPDNF